MILFSNDFINLFIFLSTQERWRSKPKKTFRYQIKNFYSEICQLRTGLGAANSNPGVDFELILEGIGANMDINDFDLVGRALVVGMTFGLQLGMTGDVSNWPIRTTFKRSWK